uniref:DUF5872 domain-containing protein n=1 Tax=viral metagenome TaxID=1070528 RepID=A0A6C0AY49_9ZZZZ
MHCKKGKSKPINTKLYNSLKNKIKKRSKVWPSAYASGQLVREYKSKGGTYKCAGKNAFSFYRCSFGSLDRWFKEKWVDVCKPKKNGKYQTCGRSKSNRKKYPYCRPLKRINSQTPKTVGEISRSKLKQMCKSKRKNPYRRVFINSFGEKTNIGENYNMERVCGFGNKITEGSCGFGRRRRKGRFGDNLGATNSNLVNFYKPGTENSSNLTPSIKTCLGDVLYDQPGFSLQRFGKKNNSLNSVNADIKYLSK